MAARKEFRILVAADGSLAATAAVVTATAWPWPEPSRAFGVVAQPSPVDGRPTLRATAASAAEGVRELVEHTLERRWPDAQVRRIEGDPTTTIVRHARRTRADVIVMGWRGHGAMRRLLLGSVSRGVVRLASCSVLVVRRASRQLRHVVIGYDGSANANRAVASLARMAPDNCAVTLVMAIQVMQTPARSMGSAAAMGTIGEEVSRVNSARMRQARSMMEKAARPLRDTGCDVGYVISERSPLDALLAACTEKHADLLVVGATGATGLKGLLVGSVAQGALDRSTTPVLVVR